MRSSIVVVVVVLTLTRIIKSVVTEQAPATLWINISLRNVVVVVVVAAVVVVVLTFTRIFKPTVIGQAPATLWINISQPETCLRRHSIRATR